MNDQIPIPGPSVLMVCILMLILIAIYGIRQVMISNNSRKPLWIILILVGNWVSVIAFMIRDMSWKSINQEDRMQSQTLDSSSIVVEG